MAGKEAEKNKEKEKAEYTKMLECMELDRLTGVYNRITFEDLISHELEGKSGGRCAFILIDIDNLKNINDGYGHDKGDRAIITIANLLKERFGGSGIVGRIGGDEFAVFIPEIFSPRKLALELSSFIDHISFENQQGKNEYKLHCSIGCSVSEQRDANFEGIYEKASFALCHVKRNGKNEYAFFTPGMTALRAQG